MLLNNVRRIRDHSDHFRHSFELNPDKTANLVNTKIIQTCAIIIFALMLVNMTTTLAGESMKLSENDSGKKVEILVGDELEVKLPGNPTTGYVWEVNSLDSDVLSLGKADFIVNGKAIGSGGMDIIRFHAIAAGTSIVRLVFHRPFEHNTPPLRIFEVTVIIKN